MCVVNLNLFLITTKFLGGSRCFSTGPSAVAVLQEHSRDAAVFLGDGAMGWNPQGSSVQLSHGEI